MKTGGLAKAEDLIMDKSISDRVKLVNISGDQVTFVSNIFRDKGVGAEGHTYRNDAIRDKNTISVDEFAEVREKTRCELAVNRGAEIRRILDTKALKQASNLELLRKPLDV